MSNGIKGLSEMNGKVYVYLKDTETKKKFLADAKAEGYSFGKTELPEMIEDNIISVKKNKQLCHVGSMGRIEFQCNGGDDAGGRFHRIDYARYKHGDEDYNYHYDASERIKEIDSTFHGVIGIVGCNCEQAAKFLSVNKPATIGDEERLLSLIEEKYDVIIVTDDDNITGVQKYSS